MGAPRVKPFHYENLERLTRQQVDLHAAVTRFLPRALPPEAFVERLTALLQKYVGEHVQFELTALREPRFGKYCDSVPDPAILFVLSCVPLDKKAILQVDFALAHILVDRMLGGSGEHSQDLRPLTNIEQGVLQFLMLKLLNLMAQVTEGTEVQFRMDSMVAESAKLRSLNEPDDLMALLSVQITIGKKAGFIRLALPHPLVEGLLAALAPQERRITGEDLERLEKICDVKLPVWIELGRVDIEHVDLSALEAGDVILLDQILIELGEHGVQGPVTLRVADGIGGGFRGTITQSEDSAIAVEIQEAF